MKDERVYASHKLRLEEVYEDKKHPQENLTLINRFIRKIKHEGLSPDTIQKNISTLVIFSKWCTIPIQEMIEDDVYDFLDYLHDHTYIKKGEVKHYSQASINSYKIVMRIFFKQVGRLDLADPLRGRGRQSKKVIERDKLLNIEDIGTLINYSDNSRDRAIIATIYEAGPRRGELLSVKGRHVEFDNNGVKVTFPEGKTGPRTVRLVFASSYLRTWISDHPIKDDKGKIDSEAYLFISLEPKKDKNGNYIYKQLSEMGLYNQLQKIAKRAGITKRVNPHSFRHARATVLAEHLTEQQMKKFLGWTQDSKMCSVYVHDPDTEGAVLSMYGMQVENTYVDGLKVGKCPWCKEINPEAYSFCGVCGRPLRQDAIDKVSALESQVSQVLEVFARLAAGQVSLDEIKEQVKKNIEK